MLLVLGLKISLPNQALGAAGCAGGAGGLTGQAGDSASCAPALGMLQGPFPWLLCSPQNKTAVLGNFWELPAAQHFLRLQLLTAWQEQVPGWGESCPQILQGTSSKHWSLHTHRAPGELLVPENNRENLCHSWHGDTAAGRVTATGAVPGGAISWAQLRDTVPCRREGWAQPPTPSPEHSCEEAAVNLDSLLETPRRASAACFQHELL